MHTQPADLGQKDGKGDKQDDLAHHDQNAGFRRFPQGLHQGNDHQNETQHDIGAEQDSEVCHALADDSGVLDKPGENRFRRKLDRDIEDQTENRNPYHKSPGDLLHPVILLCAVVRSGGWLEALTGSPQRNQGRLLYHMAFFKMPSPRIIMFADCAKLTNREPTKMICRYRSAWFRISPWYSGPSCRWRGTRQRPSQRQSVWTRRC